MQELMMKTSRREEIIRLLKENRVVKANELSVKFDVSMETIRRDLEGLEVEGVARRVHGGAVFNSFSSKDPDFSFRKISHFDEKVQIGRCAAELVGDNETVIIDLGTTTLEMARFLLQRKDLTVITNSLRIAMLLMDSPGVRVILCGGVVRNGEGTTSGFWAEDMVDRFVVDKLFLGVGAFDLHDGVTDYHVEETNLRRHFIKQAKKVFALADYSKFGSSALNRICSVKELDCLITDSGTDRNVISDLRSMGLEVIVAQPQEDPV